MGSGIVAIVALPYFTSCFFSEKSLDGFQREWGVFSQDGGRAAAGPVGAVQGEHPALEAGQERDEAEQRPGAAQGRRGDQGDRGGEAALRGGVEVLLWG